MTPQPPHLPNKPDFASLLATAASLGEQSGKASDTQIKFLLATMEGSYHNTIDRVPNKHGQDIDDAVLLSEAYVKSRSSAVVFDAKAMNQRKLASLLRTSIKLGQYTKGGNGEPLATVNKLLNERQNLRKNPLMAKKVDDAANTFLRFARAQIRRDTLIEGKELFEFCVKKEPALQTAEDVLENIRDNLNKLIHGTAANGTVQDNSAEVREAARKLTERLIVIAKGKSAGTTP